MLRLTSETWEQWPKKIHNEAFCLCKYKDLTAIDNQHLEWELKYIRDEYGFEILKCYLTYHKLKYH